MLDEAREASKHSRKLSRVMGIVAAHRLKNERIPRIPRTSNLEENELL